VKLHKIMKNTGSTPPMVIKIASPKQAIIVSKDQRP
jgi:hypothetical protein